MVVTNYADSNSLGLQLLLTMILTLIQSLVKFSVLNDIHLSSRMIILNWMAAPALCLQTVVLL